VNEALKIAGREYALWTLRMFRASDDKTLPVVKTSLAKVTLPELQGWTDRLGKIEPQEYDTLEKEIRAPSIKTGK